MLSAFLSVGSAFLYRDKLSAGSFHQPLQAVFRCSRQLFIRVVPVPCMATSAVLSFFKDRPFIGLAPKGSQPALSSLSAGNCRTPCGIRRLPAPDRSSPFLLSGKHSTGIYLPEGRNLLSCICLSRRTWLIPTAQLPFFPCGITCNLAVPKDRWLFSTRNDPEKLPDHCWPCGDFPVPEDASFPLHLQSFKEPLSLPKQLFQSGSGRLRNAIFRFRFCRKSAFLF